MTNQEIQKRLDQLPVNWSKLSFLLTGHETVIRGKGRYGIPNKYRKRLILLINVLEEWAKE
jgi:hypothetical protein